MPSLGGSFEVQWNGSGGARRLRKDHYSRPPSVAASPRTLVTEICLIEPQPGLPMLRFAICS